MSVQSEDRQRAEQTDAVLAQAHAVGITVIRLVDEIRETAARLAELTESRPQAS